MSDVISSKSAEGVLTLSFNRPAKMNAITREMYGALATGLNEAAGDFSVRAVIITSEGDHFTAGNDIKDFMENPPTSDENGASENALIPNIYQSFSSSDFLAISRCFCLK